MFRFTQCYRTFLQLFLPTRSFFSFIFLCAPKNHLHHINCLSFSLSLPPPPPRGRRDVVGFVRRVAHKEKISRNLSALFWWHGNMEKNCVYDNGVYKFLCNYVYRKISYHCQVDHWCKSRVLFCTGFAFLTKNSALGWGKVFFSIFSVPDISSPRCHKKMCYDGNPREIQIVMKIST